MYLIKDINYREELRGKADLLINRIIECYWGDYDLQRSVNRNAFLQWDDLWNRRDILGKNGLLKKSIDKTLQSMNVIDRNNLLNLRDVEKDKLGSNDSRSSIPFQMPTEYNEYIKSNPSPSLSI